jgi:excisionase family DNA binding protein
MLMTTETPSEKTTPELMTLREAAEYLHVDYDTVLRWTMKGVFSRVVRVGPTQAVRLYRADVAAQRRECSGR